ncbi:GlxA family transcriptional regulator [Halomonas caseinilytica]|uniref:Transcriptional regulator, AraC family with amidase-like domain n=1 Tax=Halomonas caseinilytica TaxID=438744 RepID=A0A1M6VDV1_9GAMM|nr:helix-turn-helix domain-containing protein [Halomonas caseinilytica]SEN03522.1 Transcriptional regulator GlxA family, contains an amidase domain and an AraC-type DNA-binding HTH domain [Halomonas caseinilytica]SHK79650.1 transcriptional regulator, AraC family with amidase-like domain [Halomonas caseinilytica]
MPLETVPSPTVGVLMLPGQVPLDLVGPLQVLHSAQRMHEDLRIRYFGPCETLDWLGPLALSGIEPLPRTPQAWDLLLVPGQYRQGIDPSRQPLAVEWLREHAPVAGTVMGICSGSLLLAEAGLLEGRRATTHHTLLSRLEALAPGARVQGDCIFIEDGPILTSAGISTGIDTMLHWLTRRLGHRLTLAVAREMVLYLRRSGHEPQLSGWLEGRNHVDERIHRLQDALCDRLGVAWSMADMARVAVMSERHLRRRFVAVAGMSPHDYLMRLRLQLARQLMEETPWSLARIAGEVGFGDDRQLRRAWRRFESGSPHAWRACRSSESGSA